MARKRLTDRALKALRPAAPGTRFEIADSDAPGLAIRVTDKGAKTFVLRFRAARARGPDPKNPLQRTGIETAHDIRLEYVSRFGDRPIDSITSRDILSVVDAATARGAPYRAHNLLAHARRLFNWAIARRVYGIDRSPCDQDGAEPSNRAQAAARSACSPMSSCGPCGTRPIGWASRSGR